MEMYENNQDLKILLFLKCGIILKIASPYFIVSY